VKQSKKRKKSRFLDFKKNVKYVFSNYGGVYLRCSCLGASVCIELQIGVVVRDPVTD